MATRLLIDDDHLVVRLSWRDRIFAMSRDARIPLSEIETIDSVDNGFAAVAGVRAPGLGVPAARKIGRWRQRSGTTLAVVRGRGPAIVVTARTGSLRSIVVSDPQAIRRAAELSEHLEQVGR